MDTQRCLGKCRGMRSDGEISIEWSDLHSRFRFTTPRNMRDIMLYQTSLRCFVGKVHYLLEAVFDVGVAISGIVQTFVLDFAGVQIKWWGNTVATAGLDFQAYNQNSSLLPIPEHGYFGLPPDKCPMVW